jgi:hypothetical protein
MVPWLVDQESLVDIMSATPLERLLLTGRCESSDCAEIVGDCQLTIKAERRSDGE